MGYIMSKRSLCAVWMVFGFWMGTTAELATAGPVDDCNQNGVPDSEDLLTPEFGDCNNNGVLDICDVDPTDPDGNGLVSIDRNGNGRPDECDLGARLLAPGHDINIKTGKATKLPPPPGLPPADTPQWITFAPDGTLYALRDRRLYTIDRENWTTTEVADLDQMVGSLTFAPDGTLYALLLEQDGITRSRNLATVSLQNGVVTVLGTLTGLPSVSAIAFAPDGTLHALDRERYGHYGSEPIPLYAIDLGSLAATGVEHFTSSYWGTFATGLTFSATGVPHISASHIQTEFGFASYVTVTGVSVPFTYGPRSIALAPDDTFYGVVGRTDINEDMHRQLYDLRSKKLLSPQITFGDYASHEFTLYSADALIHRIDVETGQVTAFARLYGDYDNPSLQEFTRCNDGFSGITTEDFHGINWYFTSGNYYSLNIAGAVVGMICGDGNSIYGYNYIWNEMVEIFITESFMAQSIPISTLEMPVVNLARGSGDTVYGVDGLQLMTVDIFTGEVTPIGPLGANITTLAYIPPRVDLTQAGLCLSGPEVPVASPECEVFDFNGDGVVDLRDLSGLWLIEQR